MGIIYQVLLRNLKVKDLGQVDLEPFPLKGHHESTPFDKAYLEKAQNNCLEKFNEIFIDAYNKRDLIVGNYPIHPEANVVAFTNTACDEYDGKCFQIVFVTNSGQTLPKDVYATSSGFSRFMLKIPDINGERPTKLWYFTGIDYCRNCYDLTTYNGEKRTSTADEYYWCHRVEAGDPDSNKFFMDMRSVYSD